MNTRRKVLRGLASLVGLGATGAWATDEQTLHENRNQLLRMLVTGYDNSALKITKAPSIDDKVCILSQAQVEGPYHLSAPIRADVTEGKQGVPFELSVQVVGIDGCTPLAGVTLEIWQCDAEGNYSAHPKLSRDLWDSLEYMEWNVGMRREPMNDDIWLRGAQQTDENGVARFQTIFPGWYDLRAPHIHFKIGGPQGELFTSQFYFDDAIASDIYQNHADYMAYGDSPYRLENDVAIMVVGGADGLVLDTQMLESGTMQASAKIGIALPNA